MRGAYLLIAAGLAVGCNGAIGDAPAGAVHPEDVPRDPSLDINKAAYTQNAQQVRLLPFSVRVAKVAAVVGKPTTDAMFSELMRRRYQLGDYDFANGIVADAQWSASRLSNWVDSLKPVCTSAEMAARYPDLAGQDLDAFFRAATGRTLTQDERGNFTDELGGLPSDERNTTACMTVLSSLEFVAL
jgi:hypothetical protein